MIRWFRGWRYDRYRRRHAAEFEPRYAQGGIIPSGIVFLGDGDDPPELFITATTLIGRRA